jgi:radical SAM superfamily enzyme YgiQ (UPF0313 family)
MPDHVLCVSAGMLAPKKLDTPLARLHRYLNYGLLGLGTLLQHQGYSVRLVHGNFEEPLEFASQLAARGDFETRFPLLLSLPSSFALGWARVFIQRVKLLCPTMKVIVGGRWVVAEDGAWIRSQLPGTDLVVYGMAESRIERLLADENWSRTPMTDRYILGVRPPEDGALPGLDFRIIDGYEAFQPCVEISRGCGMGCNFCAEANIALGDCRDEREVVRELTTLRAAYEGVIHPYFQASFFRPPTTWIQGLSTELDRQGLSLEWRAESRVDGLSPTQIGELARAGLTVLDLGLESASPLQLSRMHKTTNSHSYLRRASDLLKACSDHGVWTKVNILLSPGETRETVDETMSWLNHHRTAIKGVSVGQTIVFRYGPSTHEYVREIAAHGAKPVSEDALDRDGYTHLHLSSEMSHETALETSRNISRDFMGMDDYFDLKSFSYFPRGFSKQEFLSILAGMQSESLAFSVPENSIG